MLAPMSDPQSSHPAPQARSATTAIRTLIAAAFYLLLGVYSGHLMVCGAEFRGHEDGELVHLKSAVDGPDWQSEGALVRAAVAGATVVDAGGSSAPVPAVAPAVVAAALFLTIILFLSYPAPGRSPPPPPAGQPVGRWYRTVVLLI